MGAPMKDATLRAYLIRRAREDAAEGLARLRAREAARAEAQAYDDRGAASEADRQGTLRR